MAGLTWRRYRGRIGFREKYQIQLLPSLLLRHAAVPLPHLSLLIGGESLDGFVGVGLANIVSCHLEMICQLGTSLKNDTTS